MKLISKEFLQETRDRWVNEKEQVLSIDEVYYMKIEDLYRFRKLKRTRKNSKPGSADLRYDSVRNRRRFKLENPDKYVGGQEKWDQLRESISKDGWIDEKPAVIIMINRRSKPILRDGHHRLGVCIELGIKECPIRVKYVWKET